MVVYEVRVYRQVEIKNPAGMLPLVQRDQVGGVFFEDARDAEAYKVEVVAAGLDAYVFPRVACPRGSVPGLPGAALAS